MGYSGWKEWPTCQARAEKAAGRVTGRADRNELEGEPEVDLGWS